MKTQTPVTWEQIEKAIIIIILFIFFALFFYCIGFHEGDIERFNRTLGSDNLTACVNPYILSKDLSSCVSNIDMNRY